MSEPLHPVTPPPVTPPPPQVAPPPPSQMAPAGLPSQEDRTWAMLTHLSGLIGFIIPFGNVIGPLVLWLMKREGRPFIDDQGKEALNFQISVTIYLLVSALLIIVLIGIPLLIGIAIAALILTIIGGVKANEGQAYRYPLTIRLVT